MRTFQSEPISGKKTGCGCSQTPVRLDGYTPMDTERWFPKEIAKALEERFEYDSVNNYGFSITPERAYRFLACFEPDLALTLLEYGFTSTDEAIEFLDWYGYVGDGYYKNFKTAAFACLHGLNVNDYLDVIFSQENAPSWGEAHEMDALRFLRDCKTAVYKGTLASLITLGKVKLPHVEEVGYDLVQKCADSDYLHAVFEKISSADDGYSDPGYTASGIRSLLEKCPDRKAMLRRLQLLQHYSFETTSEITHLGFIFGYRLGSLSNETILYADKLFGELKKAEQEVPVAPLLSPELIKELSEEKVAFDFAVPLILKKETPERIVAMHAGVHNVMTEGWL